MAVSLSSRGWRLRAALFAGLAAAALSATGCDNDGPYVPTGAGAGGSGAAASTGGTGATGGSGTGGTGDSTSSSGGSGATGGSGTGGTGTGGSATGGSGGSTSGTGGTSMTGSGGSGGAMAQMVPDFSLIDANTNSMTSGQPVSPRDYLMRVSAWYFGHST